MKWINKVLALGIFTFYTAILIWFVIFFFHTSHDYFFSNRQIFVDDSITFTTIFVVGFLIVFLFISSTLYILYLRWFEKIDSIITIRFVFFAFVLFIIYMGILSSNDVSWSWSSDSFGGKLKPKPKR